MRDVEKVTCFGPTPYIKDFGYPAGTVSINGTEVFTDTGQTTIRQAMEDRGLSWSALAERAGYRWDFVNEVAHGRRAPSSRAAWDIARALEVSVTEIWPDWPEGVQAAYEAQPVRSSGWVELEIPLVAEDNFGWPTAEEVA